MMSEKDASGRYEIVPYQYYLKQNVPKVRFNTTSKDNFIRNSKQN